jgi:twinkle protein
LITIVQFAREMDICVLLVAHPRKPSFDSRGQLIPITMFDIFGSSDFNNKCDVGIVLEREKEDNVLLVKVEKMRFDPMLGSGGIVPLHYDTASGRYGNAVYDTLQAKYMKFEISNDTWLPGLGGEQQSLEFECPSTEEEECPF